MLMARFCSQMKLQHSKQRTHLDRNLHIGLANLAPAAGTAATTARAPRAARLELEVPARGGIWCDCLKVTCMCMNILGYLRMPFFFFFFFEIVANYIQTVCNHRNAN